MIGYVDRITENQYENKDSFILYRCSLKIKGVY